MLSKHIILRNSCPAQALSPLSNGRKLFFGAAVADLAAAGAAASALAGVATANIAEPDLDAHLQALRNGSGFPTGMLQTGLWHRLRHLRRPQLLPRQLGLHFFLLLVRALFRPGRLAVGITDDGCDDGGAAWFEWMC
mmetsp:Transcript_70772/g.229936  ORF Transcript_70772/g.229936 Transcript_70772/m.229936 type:complete len:137 (+) Transcript_70772:87-497(+)